MYDKNNLMDNLTNNFSTHCAPNLYVILLF